MQHNHRTAFLLIHLEEPVWVITNMKLELQSQSVLVSGVQHIKSESKVSDSSSGLNLSVNICGLNLPALDFGQSAAADRRRPRSGVSGISEACGGSEAKPRGASRRIWEGGRGRICGGIWAAVWGLSCGGGAGGEEGARCPGGLWDTTAGGRGAEVRAKEAAWRGKDEKKHQQQEKFHRNSEWDLIGTETVSIWISWIRLQSEEAFSDKTIIFKFSSFCWQICRMWHTTSRLFTVSSDACTRNTPASIKIQISAGILLFISNVNSRSEMLSFEKLHRKCFTVYKTELILTHWPSLNLNMLFSFFRWAFLKCTLVYIFIYLKVKHQIFVENKSYHRICESRTLIYCTTTSKLSLLCVFKCTVGFI